MKQTQSEMNLAVVVFLERGIIKVIEYIKFYFLLKSIWFFYFKSNMHCKLLEKYRKEGSENQSESHHS